VLWWVLRTDDNLTEDRYFLPKSSEEAILGYSNRKYRSSSLFNDSLSFLALLKLGYESDEDDLGLGSYWNCRFGFASDEAAF